MRLMVAALLTAILVPAAAADNGSVANWGACHPLEYGGTQSAPGQTGAGPFTIVTTSNGTVLHNTNGNWIGFIGCYH